MIPTDTTVPATMNGRTLQRLRYSGSVGDADIEVRGPGSITVQGDGEDLIITTADAVIRVKARKPR